MDMTPYHGRIRLTCFREPCPEQKTRMDAGCVRCSACDAFILDLEGKVVVEIPINDGKGALQRAPTVAPQTEPETTAGGKSRKPTASSLQPQKEK
jgi:hypothetical protein